MEILEQVAQDAESTVRKLLLQRMAEKKVTIYTRSRVKSFEGNHALVIDEKGEPFTLPADIVVAAAGACPLLPSLAGVEKMKPAPEIHYIGDSREPGRIMDAIHNGNRVGRVL